MSSNYELQFRIRWSLYSKVQNVNSIANWQTFSCVYITYNEGNLVVMTLI